jgi:hypothetical protein
MLKSRVKTKINKRARKLGGDGMTDGGSKWISGAMVNRRRGDVCAPGRVEDDGGLSICTPSDLCAPRPETQTRDRYGVRWRTGTAVPFSPDSTDRSRDLHTGTSRTTSPRKRKIEIRFDKGKKGCMNHREDQQTDTKANFNHLLQIRNDLPLGNG